MHTYPKILKAGSYANYVNLQSKDPDVLYFCTDNGKLFKGEVDFTNALVSVTSSTLPQTGVPGKIYYETDTTSWKTYIGSAYVEIGTPKDASNTSSVTPATTISASSDDAHVPTSKNVYLYGQDILAQAVGGSDVVKSVESGTDAGEIKVTKGDNTSADVTVTGVLTGFAQKNNTPGTVTVTASTTAAAYSAAATYDEGDLVKYEGSIYRAKADIVEAEEWTPAHWDYVSQASGDVVLAGVAVSPSWNSTTRVLTIGVAGGETVECNFGKDIFVDPAAPNRYDSDSDEIIIYLNDGDPGYLPEYDATATYSTGDQIHRDDAGTEYVYTANQDIDTPEEWTAAHWTKGDEYVAPTEIHVPTQGMIPVYTGGATSTATVTVTGTTITSAVKLDQHTGNAITIAPDTGEGAELVTGGLRVDLSSYATTAALGVVDGKADANAAEILAIYQAWGWDSFDPVTP